MDKKPGHHSYLYENKESWKMLKYSFNIYSLNKFDVAIRPWAVNL